MPVCDTKQIQPRIKLRDMNLLTPMQIQISIQVLLNRKHDHMYVFINCHLPLVTRLRPTQTRQETTRLERGKNNLNRTVFIILSLKYIKV